MAKPKHHSLNTILVPSADSWFRVPPLSCGFNSVDAVSSVPASSSTISNTLINHDADQLHHTRTQPSHVPDKTRQFPLPCLSPQPFFHHPTPNYLFFFFSSARQTPHLHRLHALAPLQPRQVPPQAIAHSTQQPTTTATRTSRNSKHKPQDTHNSGEEGKERSGRPQPGPSLAGHESHGGNVAAPPQPPPAAALQDNGVLPAERPRQPVERVPRQPRLERHARPSGRESPARSGALRRVRPSRLPLLPLEPCHVSGGATSPAPHGLTRQILQGNQIPIRHVINRVTKMGG